MVTISGLTLSARPLHGMRDLVVSAIRSGGRRFAPQLAKLQDTSLWTEIMYNTLNNDDPQLDAEDGTNGNNIFKYDSLHIFELGLKWHLAMLCVEDELTPYHEDHR
ncbi:hypothetical protein BDV34DRAFT_219135 [Aspergillus parasiticus]|uniref:Uncharacterized protein n=1 Tax=Aspergillus parasiticus TaxID=5067 RepID=A0A5N6E3A7_ASPPA|nr:hypothetical protein BDV34DRAFT_219135 [Aspergillus parasiticus]